MQWEADVEHVLVDLADRELAAGGEVVTPCLMAFAGEQAVFVAFLREFDKGAYHAPIIELLALATPLDADRLAFAISGRAWSLQDPIPPVTENADLRQRVLCIELVDATCGTPRHTSVLRPFELPSAAPARDGAGSAPGAARSRAVWGERQDLPGAEGWICSALRFAASDRARRRMRTSDADIARQARRVERLGHELHLDEAVAERLTRASASRSRARQDGRR